MPVWFVSRTGPTNAGGRAHWLRLRSASSSRGVRPTDLTTSPSSRAGAPGTPRTSTSPGRSTPTASSCPLLGAAMDGVISPATTIELGKLGGLGVLNLEGLWTRYEDPATPLFDEIRELDDDKATARMQQMYQEPIIPELVTARIRQMKEAGITTAASVTPQRTESLAKAMPRRRVGPAGDSGDGGLGRARVQDVEPLNLKRFIREFDIPVIVGGCASYQAGLHLMRTGAVGVLVGVGPGNACTTHGVLGTGRPPGHRHRGRGGSPHAPPGRDGRLRARDRRRRHVQGGRHRQGHRLWCRRRHAGLAPVVGCRGTGPPRLPLGHGHVPPDAAPSGPACARRSAAASARSSTGPPTGLDGRMDLLRRAQDGNGDLRLRDGQGVQKAEVMVAPSLQTEGKFFQRSQGVGIGH